MDSESTTKLGNRRLSSGNPCLDFVTDLESQARPPEKIPFRFLDGVAFNLTQTCARLRNLKRLELDENFLFDAGVYSIAQSISCGDFPVLETLSLMGNYISTFGFITLLFALKNRRKITEVDLSDNQINFVARVKEDEEAIDLDVPAMMLAFVKLWVGSSSENFHIALAGNQPCKSVEDKMAKAATRGVLDFQQRSVRSPSNSCFQDHDDGDEAEEDSGSMVVGSGSGGISSQGAVGTPADLSSLDDDDDDEEEEEEDEEDDDYMNAGLQIGLTSLAGGDERAASKRPRRRDGILEVTESEVEREASEMREIMRRNPIWRLQNEEFGSDDEDDGEFDPNGEESDQDDALSGLVSETEDFL
ncbi:U1 small nuclear ribonucleoprotein 70 kDa [Perkinsus chesapeaki]|uniref:U1 small nuclear ribonucleoprotein 70 kDa n=1 Tax=Perkinsus chesapeaki TaxID=330153 RepID=A0A7J6LSU6_PERCH|nr:U1 small nuclear ribonucleoprotein 70 kDa [Perkinsus chesapeaki]